jgi:pimeloyl-ACP methyl ester carboxylesterase
MNPSYLTTTRGHRTAYHHSKGAAPITVLFCHGYRSDMASTKATALAEWCAASDVGLIRLDCFAHGKSEGDFKEFTIGGAMQDVLDVIDHTGVESLIVVGSSMGGWIALNTALERKAVVKGLIGIAAAPDFTERRMFAQMTPEQRRELDEEGLIWAYSEMTDSDYPITKHFIEEARNHLMLDDVIGIDIPVHLLHGQMDDSVPWETSLTLAQRLYSEEVTVTLIKDGDHRLNRPADLALMTDAIARMLTLL